MAYATATLGGMIRGSRCDAATFSRAERAAVFAAWQAGATIAELRKRWKCGRATIEVICNQETAVIRAQQPRRRRRFDADTVADPKLRAMLETALAELPELSIRTINMLDARGVVFVGDLLSMTRAELLAVPILGPQGRAEVWNALAALGFKPK